MRAVQLTTKNGHSWTTDINGTNDEIESYFLNKPFNVGVYPEEKIDTVIKIKYI